MSDSPGVVIRIAGGVQAMFRDPARYPELIACIGEYVTRYEPQLAPLGQQWLWTSPNEEEALLFEDAAEAVEFCKQDIGTRPWDGRPDRPISVFHIQIGPRGGE